MITKDYSPLCIYITILKAHFSTNSTLRRTMLYRGWSRRLDSEHRQSMGACREARSALVSGRRLLLILHFSKAMSG